MYVCTHICSSYKYDQKVAADACPSFVMHVSYEYVEKKIGTGRDVSVIRSVVSPSSHFRHQSDLQTVIEPRYFVEV